PVLTGGFTGLIAPLVPAPFLRRAYGAEATSYNLAGVVGPAAAGALSAAASPEVAVGATAAVSFLALLAVLRVPMPTAPADPDRGSLVASVLTGLRLLVRVPELRAVTIATTLSFTGMGALPVVFPLLAEQVGQPAAAGGALFSAFALGALIGSAALAARQTRTEPLRLAFWGITGLALAFAAVAAAPTFLVALVLVALAGAMEGPTLASTLAVRAAHSPAALQTQVVTTAASLKFGGFAVGSVLAGLVVGAYGVRAGLLALAGMQVLGLVLGLLARSPRRPAR
ncbi:MAG: MFS transporter, partial [Frankiales bacterium]|nr:MFS transporter [Frankiales bacterium]